MKYILTILTSLTLSLLSGQNLVTNGGFEIYSICPNNISQINYATGWINAASRTSPDYYNSCDSGANIPDTFFGYQPEGFGGHGYAGIYTFNLGAPNDGREYIQTQLVDTLKAGKKYLASMYVNACDLYNYSTATLGMYFTSTAIQGPSTVGFINVSNPQVKNTTLLSDTVNWMLVQDTVIGTGTELYLTIGNFSYDSLSDTVKVYHMGFGHNNDNAYYYIDNVSVIDVATIGINEIRNEKMLSVYPNPTSDQSIIQFDNIDKEICTLTLYDLHGQIRRTINNITSDQVLIQKNDLTNGLYYFVLRANDRVIVTGKLAVD